MPRSLVWWELDSVFYDWKHRFKTKKKEKYDMLVIRVNKDGELCKSRPCSDCLTLLQKYSIRRIFYVDDNKNLVSERFDQMEHIYESQGRRNYLSII